MMRMRRAVWAMAMGLTVGAGAQTSATGAKDDLFAGTEKFAQGASSVTQIDMDPDELGKVDGKDGLKARKMVLSVVHVYEFDKAGMYRAEDVEVFRKKLEGGEWHCTVHIREAKSGESTDVCNKRRDDGMREEAVITVEPKSLTFIHTIRKMGAPGGMSAVGPMIAPELQAQIATMLPELKKLKDLKGPDAEQMRQMRESLKGLGGLKVYPDVEVNPQIR